jgi:hypothetical protein
MAKTKEYAFSTVLMAILIIPDTGSDLMPDACSEGWRTPGSERSDAGVVGYFTDKSWGVKFLFLSPRSSFQLNAVGIVNQPIQNGIGDGWIPDMVMPVFDGELARNKGRGIAVAVLNDFQKISSFGIGQRG